MNSFDPMAAAVDWLDAYRANDPAIDFLYAQDATIRCGCGGEKAVFGALGRQAYWASRFIEYPAGALIDLDDRGSNIIGITYRAPREAVQAILSFDADNGLITLHRCGPL